MKTDYSHLENPLNFSQFQHINRRVALRRLANRCLIGSIKDVLENEKPCVGKRIVEPWATDLGQLTFP